MSRTNLDTKLFLESSLHVRLGLLQLAMQNNGIVIPKTYQEMVFEIWEAVDWAKTDSEISRELDVNYITVMVPNYNLPRSEVYKALARADLIYNDESLKKHPKPLFDMAAINYALPNIVLSMIYGYPSYRIACARNEYFRAKAKWHLGGYSKLISDPEFLAELETEKVKAEQLGFKIDHERIKTWLKWKQEYRHPGRLY